MRPYKCRICGGSDHFVEGDGHRRCSVCRRNWSQAYMTSYNPQYREENKEELARKRAEKYERNRRKYLGMWAAWHSDNPDVAKKHRKKREAKIRAGRVTKEELQQIVERDNGQCIYCGTKVQTSCTPSKPRGFDHLIPLLSDNGEHRPWNLAVCCVECNADKHLVHFAKYIFRKGDSIVGDLSRLPDIVWEGEI